MSEVASQNFIHSLKNTLLTDVNIHLVTCEFNIENYTDDWYKKLDIHFPNSKISSLKKRKGEFLAGRCAAKEALKITGMDSDFVIKADHNGCPIWPEGVKGSITHKKNTAICAISCMDKHLSLGIDVEERICNKIAENIWQSVLSENELSAMSELHMTFSELVTLAFSAKEAVFKSIYPMIKRYVDFSFGKIIGVDKDRCLIFLRVDHELGNLFLEGVELAVRWRIDSRFIFTLVVVEN